MAYIIFVQPAVLSVDFAGRPTGLDFGAVLLATCLASGLTTIFMGSFLCVLCVLCGEEFRDSSTV
jgi:AGZA family xanthine/uracil permease-like MFS transporter